MPTHSFGQEAIDLHKKHGGKLELRSKVPLTNREELSRAYTPGVADVCMVISKDPSLASTYTLKKNTIAVVTDGSSVLGLGNIGPVAAIPVMEGKAILFKEFAGIDAFPICLATQDTEEIIQAVRHIAPVFAAINLEDIAAPRCFEIERRLQAELPIPVMHDDQHGTATVVLAALINALRLRGISHQEARIVISGAGAAGTAITDILLSYGCTDITVVDSKGAVGLHRTDLQKDKQELARRTNPRGIHGGLAECVQGATVFIGVSKAGVMTKEMVRSMQERPIIFALANPVPEIMPADAQEAGAFIVATGRSDFPNQVNNALGFPGLFKGLLASGARQFTEKAFVAAAEALAGAAGEITPERILPTPFEPAVVSSVSDAVARALASR